MPHTTSNSKIQERGNLKRFRELRNYKQDVLALEFGEDRIQRKLSLLEKKEKIDSEILEQVAAILKIPVEAIRNFDEDQAIKIISVTFDNGSAIYHNNPIDKLMQFHEERIALYERMLREKDEVILRLEIDWKSIRKSINLDFTKN